MERLREIQPAHKSDKITVAQAKKAWLKVERESDKSASRSTHGGRSAGQSSRSARKG
jgi:hypothetical protein